MAGQATRIFLPVAKKNSWNVQMLTGTRKNQETLTQLAEGTNK